jgi:hypothetical protein
MSIDNLVLFEGECLVPNLEALVELITDWVGYPKVKFRLIGEELVYSDATIYLYCYTSMSGHLRDLGGKECFRMEGTVECCMNGAARLLDRLADLCSARKTECNLIYRPQNATGCKGCVLFDVSGAFLLKRQYSTWLLYAASRRGTLKPELPRDIRLQIVGHIMQLPMSAIVISE